MNFFDRLVDKQKFLTVLGPKVKFFKSNKLKFKIEQLIVKLKCPLCNENIEAQEKIVTCPIRNTKYHDECAKEFGQCAIRGHKQKFNV